MTLLRAAATEGRLSVEELDERTASAYAAATRGELELLVDDLPDELPAPPVARRASQPRVPGRISFNARWRAPARREPAAADFLEFVAPPLQARSATSWSSARRNGSCSSAAAGPRGPSLVAVVLFPFGLLALAAHELRSGSSFELLERGDETVRHRAGRRAAAGQAGVRGAGALTIRQAGGNQAVKSSGRVGDPRVELVGRDEAPLDDLVGVGHGAPRRPPSRAGGRARSRRGRRSRRGSAGRPPGAARRSRSRAPRRAGAARRRRSPRPAAGARSTCSSTARPSGTCSARGAGAAARRRR